MYGMPAEKLIHATTTRTSETRNKTGFGAFKVSMLRPCKTYGHRSIKSDRSGYKMVGGTMLQPVAKKVL